MTMTDTTTAWRTLALRFDRHRMAALWHLRILVDDPSHRERALQFLSEPPPPGTIAENQTDPLVARLLAVAAETGVPGILDLALQLTNTKPCPDCGFVQTKCRCRDDRKLDLKVGQEWYVILSPKLSRYITHVLIDALSVNTVSLTYNPKATYTTAGGRFCVTDIEFVELLEETPCNTEK